MKLPENLRPLIYACYLVHMMSNRGGRSAALDRYAAYTECDRELLGDILDALDEAEELALAADTIMGGQD